MPTETQKYLFVEAQENFVGLLKAWSTIQSGFDATREFNVLHNSFKPSTSDSLANGFCNVLIQSALPENDSNTSKEHLVTYHIDCYAPGANDESGAELVPADEVAVQKLQRLCSMVEDAMTQLSNYYASIDAGQIQPLSLELNFNSVEDARESSEPFAPARFIMKYRFPYVPGDLENLPDLTRTTLDLQDYAVQVDYS